MCLNSSLKVVNWQHLPGSLAPAKKSPSIFCLHNLLYSYIIEMWLCLSLSNMIFTVQYGSLIHPSHVKVSRPKMPGNAFSSVWFSKIFPREYAPGPPKNGGLKPIICFPQNHNRLLLRKLWLIKSKENSRCSLFCSPKFPMWALCLINFVTNCTNGAFTAESLGKQTLQSLRSM